MNLNNRITGHLQRIGIDAIKSSLNSYLAGIVIGIIIGFIWVNDLNDFKKMGDLFFGDLLNKINKDYPTAFLSIYKTNLTASVIVIFLGLLHRYLVKAILLFNGVIFGIALFSATYLPSGIVLLISTTLPHGIVEIPAFILTGGLGISITKQAKGFLDRFRVFKKLFPTFIIISLMLLIAALIEAFLIFTILPT